MGSSIIQEKLYIKSCFEVISIGTCSFIQRINEHARATVSCLIFREVLEKCSEHLRFEELSIMQKDLDVPVFAGIIETVEIEYDGNYARLLIEAVSGTYLLDQEERYRSFSKKQGYKQMMEYVLEGKGKAIFTVDDRGMKAPALQYGETDWEFLKRSASSLGTSITPDINSVSKPRMYVGLRSGKKHLHFDTKFYKEMGGRGTRKSSRYEIDTYEDWKIGERIFFNEKELCICEKSGELLNGELIFHYVISKSSYLQRAGYFNRKTQGKEIIGRVLDTKGVWVKILLDTEVYSEHEVAFYYEWMPETGNLLYCMPEIGTYVTLYFSGVDEQTGICINCVRKNAKKIRKYWNHEEKHFALPYEKSLFLNKNMLKLEGPAGRICFNDEQGIDIISSKGMTISAKGRIKLKTGTLLAKATGEIDMIRKDILSPTIINMNGDFDVKGRIGRIDARLHYDDKAIPEQVLQREGK